MSVHGAILPCPCAVHLLLQRHGVEPVVRTSREDVDGVERGLPRLLVPEDEVDPVRQVLGDVRGLQRLAVYEREQARVGRPRGQLHVVHAGAALTLAQVQTFVIIK